MDETISYDYLWQAYQKEKQTNQLLLLSKTFYEDVNEFIILGGKNKGSSLYENTQKLLDEFFEKRKQKILIYIAYNRPLPQPISNIELEFYNKILQTVKSERLTAQGKETRPTILKSAKDIPEIILPSGRKFGPLKKDQKIGSIEEQDKVYLLENTICIQEN
jgi:DNA replication initiation complex subunit (GINS family)